jgi:hypothetical protein
MELFLMTAAMSLLAMVVTGALFVAATRTEGPAAPGAARRARVEPPRFFAETAASPEAAAEKAPTAEVVPLDALLLRIEQHIRLEEAAAEAFLHAPDQAALHSRTTSRLVN